jgi:hypothetical protein
MLVSSRIIAESHLAGPAPGEWQPGAADRAAAGSVRIHAQRPPALPPGSGPGSGAPALGGSSPKQFAFGISSGLRDRQWRLNAKNREVADGPGGRRYLALAWPAQARLSFWVVLVLS